MTAGQGCDKTAGQIMTDSRQFSRRCPARVTDQGGCIVVIKVLACVHLETARLKVPPICRIDIVTSVNVLILNDEVFT